MQLPFGLCEGNLVAVDEVPRGLGCRCICPSCKAPLVARKGRVVAHHFAHRGDAECEAGCETALHLAAKRVITEAGCVRLPAVQFVFQSHAEPWVVFPETIVHLEVVRVEPVLGGIVPDVLIEHRGRKLLLEIKVTHPVDAEKLSKIRASGLSCVEVDLSAVDSNLSLDTLRAEVVHSVAHKSWLFNAPLNALREEVYAEAKPLQRVYRGYALHVDHCPIPARRWRGKPYANVIDDCAHCKFCLDTGGGGGEGDVVLCIGHTGADSAEAWRTRARGSRITRTRDYSEGFRRSAAERGVIRETPGNSGESPVSEHRNR